MSRADWENVARCAHRRFLARMNECTHSSWWWGEWESWMAAQALSGRSPL